jgi:hypothetical protein
MPVRIGMKAAEAKQLFGIPVGIGDIIFTGLVVDSGHVPAGDRVWRPISVVDSALPVHMLCLTHRRPLSLLSLVMGELAPMRPPTWLSVEIDAHLEPA